MNDLSCSSIVRCYRLQRLNSNEVRGVILQLFLHWHAAGGGGGTPYLTPYCDAVMSQSLSACT